MNPAKLSTTYPADPLANLSGPDYHALGFSTQLDLPGEMKVFPAELKMKRSGRPRPTCAPQPELPTFPMGVIPTYNRQQNSEERLRGKEKPTINLDSRMFSGDLVGVFASLANSGKMVPAPLSEVYQGSQFSHGPRESIPLSIPTSQGGHFVHAYGEALRERALQDRADALIRQGYDARRVAKVMEEHLDNEIRNKLMVK